MKKDLSRLIALTFLESSPSYLSLFLHASAVNHIREKGARLFIETYRFNNGRRGVNRELFLGRRAYLAHTRA